MKLDAKNDPAIRGFENWVKDELHGKRTEQPSTTQTSENVWPFCAKDEHHHCAGEAQLTRKGPPSRCGCSCHEYGPPAPRAGDRERVILNSDLVVRPMPKTLLKTKCLLATDDGWPVAEFYREEEAEGIAHEHNQHSTLVAQQDRLSLAAYRAVTRMADLSRWLEKNDARVLGEIVAECLADLSVAIPAEQVTTIEQSVKNAGEDDNETNL